MDIAKIFEWVLQNGGPAFVVVCGFGYYIHRQSEKKEAEIVAIREENKALVTKVISSSEARLTDSAEHRALLTKLIDKNGATNEEMRAAFARMEANQLRMMEELAQFRKNH